MPIITYLPDQNKYRVEFGRTICFPRNLLTTFFPDAELLGKPYTQYDDAPIYIDGLVCTEAQWARFTQFRRDAEEVNSIMYRYIDAQLNEFLLFAARMNPTGQCVLD